MVGWVSDRLKRRKPVMMSSAVLGLLFISLVLYCPHLSVTALMLLLFLYGMSNVAVAISYAVASDMVSCDISGIAMSFTNMASVLVGALFQPLIGLCLDWGWDYKIRRRFAGVFVSRLSYGDGSVAGVFALQFNFVFLS